TQVNVDGAIEMCLRKADTNKDSKLSFSEFRSLMRSLREPRLARHSANLVFALFDLDGNHFISRSEFQELYRFLLGRTPSNNQFEEEWDRLLSFVKRSGEEVKESGEEYADQRSYIHWLQTSEDPKIRQQAPECQPQSAAPKAQVPSEPSEMSFRPRRKKERTDLNT
ncbi:unnamed protein product, partial [Durusdinium trenchii]